MTQGNLAAVAFDESPTGEEALVHAINTLVEKLDLQTQSATGYETFTQQLPVRVPVLLMGVDMSRRRALIRTNTDDVFVGKFSELANSTATNPLGYPLPQAAGDEFKNTDELYVVYNPGGTPSTELVLVSVLIERNAARA